MPASLAARAPACRPKSHRMRPPLAWMRHRAPRLAHGRLARLTPACRRAPRRAEGAAAASPQRNAPPTSRACRTAPHTHARFLLRATCAPVRIRARARVRARVRLPACACVRARMRARRLAGRLASPHALLCRRASMKASRLASPWRAAPRLVRRRLGRASSPRGAPGGGAARGGRPPFGWRERCCRPVPRATVQNFGLDRAGQLLAAEGFEYRPCAPLPPLRGDGGGRPLEPCGHLWSNETSPRFAAKARCRRSPFAPKRPTA